MAFQALNHSGAPVIPPEVLQAFADQPQLSQDVIAFIARNPYSAHLLRDISSYIVSLKRGFHASQETNLPLQPPKKRKLDQPGSNIASTTQPWADTLTLPTHTIPSVSISIPVRKKLHLELLPSGFRAISASGEIEFGISWPSIAYAFCLPVPEKAKPQHNVVLIPHRSSDDGGAEPIVWSVMDGEDEPARTARLLNECLGRAVVVGPSDEEFAGAKSYGVKAHRGSKDGYLFFLAEGILWGFKKPLLFLPFEDIESISYTSVLQRTFNLNVVAGGEGAEQEIEFAMLDQADFAGIDAYVKRHGLQDASLAASRKAKVYNVNRGAAEGANGAAGAGDAGVEGEGEDGDGETELQRAERMLQDEEDEEEDDYVEDDEGSEEEGSSEDEGWEGDEVHGNGAEGEEEDDEEEE